MSCLQAFTLQRVLEQHEPYCLAHAPQQCVYPSRASATLRFNMHHSKFPFDFYLVANFECFLRHPSVVDDGDEPNVHAFYIPSGFCVFCVTNYESYRTDPIVYSGDDVMGKFFSHIFAEAKTISQILSRNVLMAALTASEQAEYDSTTICTNCKRSFTDDNQKTRHHNHVTGKYLFPACNSCNLVLKPRKCKIVTTQSNSTKVIGCDYDDDGDDDGDGGEWTHLVPIVFHNLSAYDGHFILQFFRKVYIHRVYDEDGDESVCRRGRHSAERIA